MAKKKAPAKKAPAKRSGNAKACAILSYLIVGIIWYFVDEKMQKDAAVKFHVKQGIVLVIASAVLQLIGNLVYPLAPIVSSLGGVLVLVWLVLGVINAANDEQKELFWIGQFAKKLTF